jgi:glycine cleavage system aminomethyltransferase T
LNSGCVFQERNGIQRPAWFDLEKPKLTFEQYLELDNTFDWQQNSRQWKAIKYECKSCRECAAIFNLSSMGKFFISGQNAFKVLDMLCPTDIKSMPDNSTLVTYFLNSKAGIDAEIVLSKINGNEFYITCPDIGANHVLAHFRNLIFDQRIQNIEISDLTKEMTILSIQGPQSKHILEKSLGICLDSFENMTHREMEISVRLEIFFGLKKVINNINFIHFYALFEGKY